jgi:dienelactone hydrolase
MKFIKSISLVVFCLPQLSNAWTYIGTYPDAVGNQLRYVIAAPQTPTRISKLPVVFFESGDGTDMSQDQFVPSQMGPMMEQLSQAAGVILVAGELRRQMYINKPSQICELDFNRRVEDLGNLVDQIKSLPYVDAGRIFLFAHSAGGETVTRLALHRDDIHGIFTVSSGVVSCSEDALACPFPALQMSKVYSYVCSPNGDEGREGLCWRQLFLQQNLQSEIRSLKIPYFAIVGSLDHEISVQACHTAEVLITKTKSNFSLDVISGANHGSGLTDPRTIQALIQFIKSNE